ncbi:hypothetical protein G6O69_08450 [Pseudenhygromyxa sp. WMMC2535]|uniref:GAF domain-containing protein n=1 Tax=Pseudenhygromyxa sp. WMMC2535 TaxID=2712867 RepID=UPI0015960636|nr:GAF domain-containing protein [Pseudenhygromyxa sp. WMMC2535]NVB37862.1 hypothetical protein [Pseudenhygromyxa sp. WMMC2535]
MRGGGGLVIPMELEEDLLAALERTREALAMLAADSEQRSLLMISLTRELGELETKISEAAAGGEPLRRSRALSQASLAELLSALDEGIGGCERERQTLITRFEIAERSVAALGSRMISVEERRETLLNLWVAGSQLQEAESRERVRAAILEVIINLIGCEELGVFELREDGGERRLELRASMGLDEVRREPILLEAEAEDAGEAWLIARLTSPRPVPFLASQKGASVGGPPAVGRGAGMSACLPLVVDGRLEALVLTWGLLGHKLRGFTDLDRALLRLLAAHAGSALVAAHTRGPAQIPELIGVAER